MGIALARVPEVAESSLGKFAYDLDRHCIARLPAALSANRKTASRRSLRNPIRCLPAKMAAALAAMALGK
jgi:hypothetical protein